MSRVSRQSNDPVLNLYRWVQDLETRIRQLKGTTVTVDVRGATTLADGDGQIWLETDGTLHYRVNNHEYKLTGTLVA